MTRKITYTILFFLVIATSFGQDQTESTSFLTLPDTFTFHKAVNIQYVKTLNNIDGKIFDSISSPKAYFIDNYKSGGGYSWSIALKKKENYLIFNPFETGVYAEITDLKFERIDFDGKGNDELIIKWQFYAGHSGWENSVHERTSGILIWNLDNLTQLMDFKNYYSFQNWWTEYTPDSTNSLDYSEREIVERGGKYECESYKTIIKKKHVHIKQENYCPDQDDNNKYIVSDNNTHIYILTRKGLIKK